MVTGHQLELYNNIVILMSGETIFSNRVINVWNSLPLIVYFSTLRSFKRTVGLAYIDFANKFPISL